MAKIIFIRQGQEAKIIGKQIIIGKNKWHKAQICINHHWKKAGINKAKIIIGKKKLTNHFDLHMFVGQPLEATGMV